MHIFCMIFRLLECPHVVYIASTYLRSFLKCMTLLDDEMIKALRFDLVFPIFPHLLNMIN